MGQQRSAEQGRQGGRQGAGGDEERAPGGAEEEQETPQAGGVATQLRTAVSGRDTEEALRLAAGERRNGAVTALQSAGVEEQFYNLIRRGRPFTSAQRQQLTQIYNRTTDVNAKQRLFSARFNIQMSAASGAQFTESEMDMMHEQAAALPPGHVEGVPGFRRLHRLNQQGGGSHNPGTDQVNMGAAQGERSFKRTFRHEIGHAIDDSLGSVEDLRTTQAGWGRMTANQFLEIARVSSIPAPLRTAFKNAFVQFTEQNTNGQGATASFDAILQGHLERHFPGQGQAKLQEVQAAARGTLAYEVGKQSFGGGAGAHMDFRNYQVAGGNAYFCSHYYKKVMKLSSDTFSHMQGWNNPAAAFSDKEWFAEIYAEWYSKEAGTSRLSRSMPGYVQSFMRENVETYRQGDVVAHSELSGEGGPTISGGPDSDGPGGMDLGGWG